MLMGLVHNQNLVTGETLQALSAMVVFWRVSIFLVPLQLFLVLHKFGAPAALIAAIFDLVIMFCWQR